MPIQRTYRRDDDGVLQFREAWFEQGEGEEAGQFVINHGTVGNLSTTKEAVDVDAERGAGLMEAFADQCATDGFAELTGADQSWVIAQYALKTTEGTQRDEYLRDKAMEALRGHLAWRGLGTVESSDFAPRKLNIRILSPEPGKAVTAITTCIRQAKLDFTKLSIGVAPHDAPEAAKQKYPMPPKTPFSVA
ncbi:hypothetical protein ACT3S2_03360 [Arthrobacter sp. AOP36-A1-22]|uniref:hypothetical protein n=1 Tax=unclassified Arthrobacter TaxID=235627 RepID=UPI004034B481